MPGIVQRLFGRRVRPETRTYYGGPSFTLGNGGASTANWNVAAVENLAAITGAVELIANSIASLPATIVQDTDDGPEPMPGAAAARLLARPNPRQSWPSFMQSVVSSVLLQGNAVVMLGSDGRGAVSSLTPVPWTFLLPQVIGSATGARLAFDLVQNTPEAQLLGIPARLLADTDTLHIKARADNGILGRSVLSRAPSVLGAAVSAQQFASTVFENAATPNLAVMLPPSISADGKRRIEAFFRDHYTGPGNARVPMFFDADTKLQPLSLSPEDAEVLQSRRFGVAEIARLFCIPLPMLDTGGAAPPASLTPYLTSFATLALLPIVTAIEAEFNTILPPGQHLSLDLAGLTRGDWTAVASAQAVLVQSGIATPNDARRALGLAAHPDGDDLGRGSAPNYPADAAGLPSLAPKPGPTGTGLPNVDTHQNGGAA